MYNDSRANLHSRTYGWRRATACLLAILCCATILFNYSSSQKVVENPVAPKGAEVRTAVRAQASDTDGGKLASPLPIPSYLRAIEIPDAWAQLNEDVTSTIAIVDTGVDFNIPELKALLMNGKNLINERKSAQDDNGHGTAVAGVIAAVAKAGESSPGKGRWKGKLLPVKSLDQFGAGNEEKLTQGIIYAVDQGADIIVLSLGLRRDAPGLRDAVAYAERRDVLLIAASGNDAAVFGEKAAVQYPAAYPSVLSVTGLEGKKPVAQATAGPENDVGAPWRVQTLAVGGGGIEMEGTSMGAPQVAAVAAMIKAEHPDWKPIQIRETIRKSAQAVGGVPWSPSAGYGLLSAAQALQADDHIDWRKPNNTKARASEFPLGKEVVGAWGSPADSAWYVFDAPYDGVYGVSGDAARFALYGANGIVKPFPAEVVPEVLLAQWPVKKGRNWLQVRQAAESSALSEGYRLVSAFAMNPDAFEPNDTAATAAHLPARSQEWTGTFHKRGDVDWFVINLPKPGILKLTVTPDTTRIDPEIRIQPAGGQMIIVDERGDGGIEYWTLNNAKAGKYYFRISNAVSSNPEAVIGTYTASLEYITDKEDFYEPNDSALTATPLTPDKIHNALIQTAKDQDWFKFQITKAQTVKLDVSHIPAEMKLSVELRDKKLQTLSKWSNGEKEKTLSGEKKLTPGTYHLRVTADRPNRNQYYGLWLQYSTD
ncbi:S8 family serine peptidase [Cohnella terricola]|uniref:S8 family serine peptidase n=1 Tax=Cohnella terricola TaxID=1289167 RepID=UPI0016488CBE|nr:S8 family serine peptidase [Cohnella terricola]